MKRDKPVTMQQIADEAGVSAATVSLVLSKSPRISAGTREKVLEIASRLGYLRNPYVSALMASRRKRGGNLDSDTKPVLAFCTDLQGATAGSKASLFLRDIFHNAAERASEKGYRLDTFNLCDEGISGRRLAEILYTRSIPGMLVFALPELRASAELEFKRFSVVSLGFGVGKPMIDRVACDYFQAVLSTMEQCHRKGYRKVALALSDDENRRINRRWLAAYLVGRQRWTELVSIPPLIMDRWNYPEFFRWLRKVKPDVVISSRGESLLGKLEKDGWSVPGDIGLVSLNIAAPESKVSGIFQNPGLLAARAVDMLVGAIERNERGLPEFPNTLFVDGAWNPGTTIREGAGNACREDAAVAGEPPKKFVSMRDLAGHLGVHVSTVSLSLNNSPKVPEATKQSVQAAAAKFGFRKNPYVSTLMKERRSGRLPRAKPRLAFISTFPTRDMWRRRVPTIVQCFRGAQRWAKGKGFVLEEEWLSPEDRNGRALSEKLRRRSVQGLMFAPLPRRGLSLSLDWKDFCLVAFGFTIVAPPVHRVCNDHYSSMRRAIRECYRLGYRRIGLAMSSRANNNTQNRWLAAFLMQQHELKDLASLDPLIIKTWTKRQVLEWLKKWSPDVLITPHPNPLLKRLRLLGISVPEEIGFCSLTCPAGDSSLTGISQSPELLGARATDILINLIEKNEYGVPKHPFTLMVDGIWNPGATVRPQ